MKFLRFLFLSLIFSSGFFFFSASDVWAQSYYLEGVFVSSNLLVGESDVGWIKTFNATTSIPTGTTIEIMFSQDGTEWCARNGITWRPENLSDGANSIDISGMRWSGAGFYYKIKMESDVATTTPELLEVSVEYTEEGPPLVDYGNYNSGVLLSSNMLVGQSNVELITDFIIDIDIPAQATATVQFSKNGTVWTDSTTGISWRRNTLSNGVNNIDLRNLGWSGANFYYKLSFTTASTSSTPTANEVEVHYSDVPTDPFGSDGIYYKQGAIVSENLITNPLKEVALESFGYRLILPASTTAWIQFSNDGETFYSATGTEWGWSDLPSRAVASRDTAIDLSGLGWTADKLYYKVKMESLVATSTPSLVDIRPYYASGHRIYTPDTGFLTDGLVGHWTFDGPDMEWGNTGAEVRDRSGQGNHGSLQGGMGNHSATIGQIGQALRFDGVNDYVVINDLPLNNTNAVTVSFWFKTDYLTSDNKMLFEPYGSNAFYINMNEWGVDGCLSMQDNGVGFNTVYTSKSYADGKWHHFTGVIDRNQGVDQNMIFVNGVRDFIQYPSRYNDIDGNFGGPHNAYIFSRAGNVEFVDGLIDEVRVYDHALSEAEIQKLYEYGKRRMIIRE